MWKYCNRFIFIAFLSVMPLYGIKIGSDTAVSSENFLIFPADDTDNEIKGFVWMDAGFALADSLTTCTFASFFPARGPIQLNCGTLWLERDLLLHNVTTFTCLGNIRSSSLHTVSLASGARDFGCVDPRMHTFENIHLKLTSNIVDDAYVTFAGKSIIDGNGYILDLNNTGSFIIAANSSLTFKDMTLVNFSNGNIACIDDSSQLILDDVTWEQSDAYTFDMGSILFKHKVSLVGSSSFVYSSMYTSTIASNSELVARDGLFLKMGRDENTLRDPFYFTDSTSVLILDGCTLAVTDSGIQFTRGQIIIEDDVVFDLLGTATQTGLMLGDGVVANDVELVFKPGSTITHNSGYLVYNNVSASKFKSLSKSARFFRNEDSKLAVQQNFNVNNIIMEVASATVMPAEIALGKSIYHRNSLLIFPSVEVEATCQQINSSHFLSGNDSLFLAKGEFPSAITVSGVNNTLRGNGSIAGSITLSDSASELTWDMRGAITNSLTLNNGTLTLAHDMDLIGAGIINGPGIVDLGSSHLWYKKKISGAASLHWQGSMNSHIDLCCNTSLASTWTVQGMVTINGQGNEFALSSDAALVVNAGSQLVLKDIIVTGIKQNNIRCLYDDASIKLEDAALVLDGDYTFTTGSLLLHLDACISGTNSFTYDSAYTSTICKNSMLQFKGGVTFAIGRKDVESSEPLLFEDKSAILCLDDSTLLVGDQGMQITKGTVRVSRGSTIDFNSTSTTNGLMLGNGQASGDTQIELDPSALLTFKAGHFVYNVTHTKGIKSQSKTVRIIHEAGFITHYMRDFVFETLTNNLDPLTAFSLDPGVSLRGSNMDLETPFGNYRISGRRGSATEVSLEGNGDYIFVDFESWPFAISVGGTDNTIGGEGDIAGTITFQDSSAELTSRLLGRIHSNVVMNGGSLSLGQDLHLASGILLSGDAIVNLGDHGLYFGPQVLTWSGGINWISSDGSLNLNANLSLSGTWTVNGSCTIHGNGYAIDLGATGALVVGENSSLSLYNVTLKSIGGDNVRCISDDSVIILDKMRWQQEADQDYTFTIGSFRWIDKVQMSGSSSFVYQTVQTSTIDSCSQLKFDTDFTFSYDAPAPNLIHFVDSSSKIILAGATLHATSTGLELTTGKMDVIADSSISSEVILTDVDIIDNGIMFGLGLLVEDFKVELFPNVALNCISGSVKYNNIDSQQLQMVNNVSRIHFYSGTTLWLYANFDIRPGCIEFDDQARIMQALDKTITGSIMPRGFLIRGRFTP